jgi:Raf kinase inhibitor-like YbhB/YbcL family protein
MAQPAQPNHSGAAIVFEKIEPYADGEIVLTSDAIDIDGWLSAAHSQDGDETSPPLAWQASGGVVSYALIVQDPDAPRDEPALHWMMWNIPGSLHALPAGIAKTASPDETGGATQGKNTRGEFGWLGMKPPVGHGPHRYYFQLFGLDRRLDDLPPDTSLDTLTSVLKGATLAKGELIGKFEIKDPIADAPSPARTGSYGADQPSP